MARIAGVDLPRRKPVSISLTYIYGIGRTSAHKICEQAHVELSKRTDQLTDQEVVRLRQVITDAFRVEGDLRRDVSLSIKRLMDLGCYRGVRHRKGLPVRGQNTHNNARTRKGKAKPIAGKKK